MEWSLYVVAILFALIGFVCLLGIPLGLPGTWMLIALAVVIEFGDGFILPGEDPVSFGWPLIGVCVGLGLLGEVIEAAAGAAGTRFGGGTGRGMIGAIAGGILGALLLTLLLPLPLVGTLVGALLGTFAGAFVGEATAAAPPGHVRNLKAALAATLGRLAGTFAKMAIAFVMLALLVREILPA